MNKIYLGDSVYAEWAESHGVGMIKLTTDNGYPDDPRNVIYLELQTLGSLLDWLNKSGIRQCARL